jgi:uncharacterized protein (TIGR02594 family)
MNILKVHSHGQEVRQLQILLNRFISWLKPIKADGSFGGHTRDRLKLYQIKNSLKPDGEFGPVTRKAMHLTPAEKSPIVRQATGKSWLDIAKAEEGIAAISLPGKHSPRIVEYHATTTLKATDDETPWCSSFVNWVLKQAGDKGTNSAAAKSWTTWGVESKPPTQGCIIVIKNKASSTGLTSGSGNHVGFFQEINSTHVKVFGGNQSNQVKSTQFPLSKWTVLSYRRK